MKEPYIIAEIGVNHNGDLNLAIKSIKAAAKCGANAVKFQSFDADEFMTKGKHFYTYQTHRGIKKEKMYEMFKRLELPKRWYEKLITTSKENGVDFLSSAADIYSANLLNKMKVKAIKLSSEDLINYPLLEHVAGLGRKTILSTGMADQKEVDTAVSIFKAKKTKFALLHCVSVYPTPEKEANLSRMISLAKRYKVKVGFSDHTLGIEACLAATALGATILEKHFTLNKKLVGPDHLISSDPEEFKKLIDNARKVYSMLGSNKIAPSASEKKSRNIFRRSIVAKDNIIKWQKLNKSNVSLKRPGSGLHPRLLKSILGRKAKKYIIKYQQILLKDLF